MDSLTHIYFADKLLQIVGGNRSAAIASLFPQIDREPAYFHRMFGHPFVQIGWLTDVAVKVYVTGEIQEDAPDSYAWVRYLEDRPRIQRFARQYEEETGERLGALSASHLDVVIGFASHTYQDIFNNPMQAFLPEVVYPCGKWQLWADLEDAIGFRTILYQPENIKGFRDEFFGDPLWQTTLDPQALVAAMVYQTADACVFPVPPDAVESSVKALGVESDVESSKISEAVNFLAEHEVLLERMIRKYSKQAFISAMPESTGISGTGGMYPVGS